MTFVFKGDDCINIRMQYDQMCADPSIRRVEADSVAIWCLSRDSSGVGLPPKIKVVILKGLNQLQGENSIWHLGKLSCYNLQNLAVLEFSECEISLLPSCPSNLYSLIFRKCRFHRRRYEVVEGLFTTTSRIQMGTNFQLNCLPKELSSLRLIDCQRSKMTTEFKKGEQFKVKTYLEHFNIMADHWVPTDDNLFCTFPDSLESFEISKANITDKTLEKLPNGLKELSIESCLNITDKSLEKLPRGLKKLSVASCPNIKMVLMRGNFLFPVASISGLSLSTDIEQEYRKKIASRLCCQPKAVDVGASALVLSTGRKSNSGIGSIILCSGPSGVGKTEFAKVLGDISGRHVDLWKMDQFRDSSTTANLFGSPIGYKSEDKGSPLANAVLKNPDVILVFDEIEKAHHDVLQSLLTLFSEGNLETSDRTKVDFSQTTIILTSNLGKPQLIDMDWSDEVRAYGEAEKIIEKLLIDKTSEEFRGRITEILPFKPFTPKALVEIIGSFLNKFIEKIKTNEQLDLTIDDSVWLPLVDLFNPKTGARGPLNALRKDLEKKILAAKSNQMISPEDRILFIRDEKGEIKLSKI